MTREEAWNRVDIIITTHEMDDVCVYLTNEKDYDALRIARKILMQQPCEDCISRQAVFDQLAQAYDLIDAEHRIKELTSVTPKPKRRMRLFKIIDNNTGKEPTYDVITEQAKLGNLMTDDIDGFYVNENGQIILVDDCGNCTWLGMNRFDIESEEEI